MALLSIVAGGVLFVALFHLGAGWFIANDLYRNAIAIGPRRNDLSVRVRALASDTIVLESPTPRQDIGHPGRMGLRWPGGYAQVGEVLDADGMRIIRALARVEGSDPPICEGPIQECPPLEMENYFYPHDPGDVGLHFEEIAYDSPLGAMGGWLVPARPARRWAVHCHGWTAERRELVRMLPTFHERHFTSLVIDYRNDPGAPKDPSGLYRFGLTEWEDLEAAVRYALDHGAGEVVLTGCSTGAAVVMSFLERSKLAEYVVGLVLDSPNVILVEAVRHATRERNATPLMIEFGLWIADLRWRIDWEATNYVSRSEETIRMPALVFHGTSDQRVPVSVSRQLQARVPELVDLVETPAAGHVMSWNADPERYETYLSRFLERL